MARHTSGWFKCHRSALGGDLDGNLHLWGLWNRLLYMATWKTSKVIWNGTQRTLEPGSILLSPREIAGRWKCSPRTISKWLKYLADTDRIVLETCAVGTLVIIRNWDVYQDESVATCAPSPQGLPTDCASPARRLPLSKKEEGRTKKVRADEDLPQLAKIWNENHGPLPAIRGCTGNRMKSAIARWTENPSAEFWANVIRRSAESSFLSGQNDKRWQADFDWLIRPGTADKVLEGKYDDRKAKPNSPQTLTKTMSLDNIKAINEEGVA